MFLKSLTLKGFKSFAETTTLEFEPGVTVVVGPNGSGKSNIVDAVAWVLGAQGPRTVRSSKMEDVIFAGSSKRPALGRAEVSLTIDNTAGLLPIEFTEVTITRTLFRNSGESEYAINGAPCRLLDLQELLSDSGVGRQQHVIVSQGQLDAVLNARPEDRRLIIEEAAGVLKYRRRREKAQRRLEATEGNLLRLGDLLREVRRQLRPLERQAEAARVHGDLVGELGALRLHLAGREIASLRTRTDAGRRARGDLAADEGRVRSQLADLDTAVLAAESTLSELGDDGLDEAVARLEGLRERARGLGAVLVERRRATERERAVVVDQSVVAALEAEAARVGAERAEVEEAAAALVPRADHVDAAERELAAERAAFDEEWGDGVPAPAADAAQARGELSALQTAVDRGAIEMARLESRLGGLEGRAERLAAETERLRGEIEQTDAAEPPLVAGLDAAEARRVGAANAVAESDAALRTAEAARHRWSARAEALAQALDETRARAGAEALADLAGVVGTLVEIVDVDPGWEAAFEAAAGEVLAAVVVDDVGAAREAVARLQAGDSPGSLLAGDALAPSAFVVLDPGTSERVRGHVRSDRPEVARVLDVLLAPAVAVDDWQDAVDLSLAHPHAVVVTRAGDRFAGGRWRTGGAASGITRAALDEARAQAAAAAVAAESAEERLAAARGELAMASSAESEVARRLDEHDARLTAVADALQRVEAERRDVTTERDAVRGHVQELAGRVGREMGRIAELEESLPALEAAEAAGVERVGAMRAARRRIEERAAAVAALRTDLEVRAAGLDERRGYLARRAAELDERLDRAAGDRAGAEARRVQFDVLLARLAALAALVADRLTTVEAALADVRERRRRRSEAARAAGGRLDGLRRERVAAERALEEVRETARRAELDEAEARLRLETAVETVRREFDGEPDAAVAADCPPLPAGTTAAGRVRELERDLRLMGPINPLALEEFTTLQERHGFLEGQLNDVRASRRDLAKVIRAIDEEIVQLFSAAWADVAENFGTLFETLFPGGLGRLRLTDPDNPLETGIEVEARPVGKNVRKLSLLSGGERSLTALAFLFAVFRSRPSPFYLLDEVEAALDDVNLHRFLDLVHEFREEAQLLVVTHQKRTMESADCLYGVTMQPGGSSKVVSERVSAGA